MKRFLTVVGFLNLALLVLSVMPIAWGRRQPPPEALQAIRAGEASFRDVIDFSRRLAADMPSVGDLLNQHGPPCNVELNYDGFSAAVVLRYRSFSARVAQSEFAVGLRVVTSRLTPDWRIYRLEFSVGDVDGPCVDSDWRGFTSLVRYFPGAAKGVE